MRTILHIRRHRGFTIFFAMLVGSLSLAIGLSIYDLTSRELDLSATATQSQYAIFLADSGAECALYWDLNNKFGAYANYGQSSVFATSTASINYGVSNMPQSGIWCNGTDIAADATSPWTITAVANAATTTFTFSVPEYQGRCTVIEVGKFVDTDTTVYTNVIARGYNTCSSATLIRLERVLQLSY